MLDDSPATPPDLEGQRLPPSLKLWPRGRVARMLLPALLVAALVQASDVIGMAPSSTRPPLPEPARFGPSTALGAGFSTGLGAGPSTGLGAGRRGESRGGRLAFGTPQKGRRVSPSDVR